MSENGRPEGWFEVDHLDDADMMRRELVNLAMYANGDADEDDPTCTELRDYPSGADMVDYVSDMLRRLGIADLTYEGSTGMQEG